MDKINKLLCKYLDIEKKGYVVLGDVIYCSILFILIVFFGLMVLFSLFIVIIITLSGNYLGFTYSLFNSSDPFMGFGLLLWIAIIPIGLAIFDDYIFNLKITRCKLKTIDEEKK